MEKHSLLQTDATTPNGEIPKTTDGSGTSRSNTYGVNVSGCGNSSENKMLQKRRKSEERKLKAVLEKLENDKVRFTFFSRL